MTYPRSWQQSGAKLTSWTVAENDVLDPELPSNSKDYCIAP